MSSELDQLKDSPLYSEDLAPVPQAKRTWTLWNLAAIWVGMAVCIPTYILASYMIRNGIDWRHALLIVFVANLIVTLPMILNGHAGVKYGIPFPVLARAAFGTRGVHFPALARGLVACGWFGVQTWIGGLAIYAILCILLSLHPETGLSPGKFVGFGLFWLLNLYFIHKGTESIRWLENLAAPILLIIGLALIGWGVTQVGSFGGVLEQSAQLEKTTAVIVQDPAGPILELHPLINGEGLRKASHFRVLWSGDPPERSQDSDESAVWTPLTANRYPMAALADAPNPMPANFQPKLQFRNENWHSSWVQASFQSNEKPGWSSYLLWLTAMVGFWATMSISISDITRHARSQRDQALGQLIGLPGTMLLYSFVGIFVTCAALIVFPDILVSEDAPWDPVTLVGKFESPIIVVIAQLFMLIATLSTNIAANVIAPSYAFANAFPQRISFRGGGWITALIGCLIAPWWLMDEIGNLMIFVSGLLGPVLGVLLADYYLLRRQKLDLAALYDPKGNHAGVRIPALIAVLAGIFVALIGAYLPSLVWLYRLSWFSGCFVSILVYLALAKKVARPQ